MTNSKKMYFLIILKCFFFISCSNNSKKINFIICKDSVQYWDYNMIRGSQDVWFTYSFNKNGIVQKYSYNKETNKRWLFLDYGYEKEFKWKVTDDSILNFMDSKLKIIKISDDTIFTFNKKTKEFERYMRVRGKLNIQK